MGSENGNSAKPAAEPKAPVSGAHGSDIGGRILDAIERLKSRGEPFRSAGAVAAEFGERSHYSVHLMHRGRESLHTVEVRYAARSPLADALADMGILDMVEIGALEMVIPGFPGNTPLHDWRKNHPRPAAGSIVLVGERGRIPDPAGAESAPEPSPDPKPESDGRFLKEWRERAWETSERRRKAWGRVEGARMLLDHLTAERRRIDDAVIVARKRLQDAWGENSNAIDEEVCIPHHLVAHYESGGLADEPAKRHHLEDVQSWFQPEIQRGTESDPDGGTGIGEPESSGWVYRAVGGEWRDVGKMEPYGENAPALVRRSGISESRRDSGMRMEEGRIAAENDFADSDPESLCPHDWVEDRRDFCTGFHHRKREMADDGI